MFCATQHLRTVSFFKGVQPSCRISTNLFRRRVTPTTSLLDRVKQIWNNAFNEIDIAGSEALEGMKFANIKLHEVSSSSLLAKVCSLIRRIAQELSIRTYIESLTCTRAPLRDGGTSGLTVTLLSERTSQDFRAREHVDLGDFYCESRSLFARSCCLCHLCDDDCDAHYSYTLKALQVAPSSSLCRLGEDVGSSSASKVPSHLADFPERIKLCQLWLRSNACLKSQDYVSWDCRTGRKSAIRKWLQFGRHARNPVILSCVLRWPWWRTRSSAWS